MTAPSQREHRASKWILWFVLLGTVPVPFFMVETGWVPTARLVLFAALTGAVAVSERDATATYIAAIFAIQALLFGGALYAAAAFLSRRLAALAPRRRLWVVVAAVAALLAVSLFDVYRMPFSKLGSRGNLARLFR